MLFNTSLIALVSTTQNSLVIYNTKRNSTICDIPFQSPILAVKLNKKRLVVALEESLHIYDMANMKLLHTIHTTMNAASAVCALSPSSDQCYLAYLPSSAGEVLLYDADNLQAIKIIEAHKNPLSFVAFSFDGKLMATASDKGTVIRVFEVPSGTKKFQFRRGTYTARIHSLSFSISGNFLSVASDTDTIHIFKLEAPSSAETASQPKDNRRSFGSSVYDTLLSPVSSTASYLLPAQISEIWEPQRDFAFAKIPSSGRDGSCICAITENHLLNVATASGHFYQYTFDRDAGGECSLRISRDLK